MKSQPKKVYVGMSGGVDSSVSAALLKQQGYDVTGVFIKVWEPDWMQCTSKEDRLDAMRVAAHLDIPFITVDFSLQYKKEVVDYMISEYKAGRTPNPDVMCNQYVKFGAFFDWAIEQGADAVATGHYARIAPCTKHHVLNKDSECRVHNTECKVQLLSGLDPGKDQSYFLWTLTQRELSKTLFPVGGMEKSETRKLAKKFKLPNAEKRDSQGLCFIGKVDIKEFLSHYIESKQGNVLDEKGEIIGEHDGSVFFTLGERHGFRITKKTPDDKPFFVVGRDLAKNTITVSHKSKLGNLSSEKRDYSLIKISWTGEAPIMNKTYNARIRHLGELSNIVFKSIDKKNAKISFAEPIVVASGQSVVFYDGEECLGGGVVE